MGQVLINTINMIYAAIVKSRKGNTTTAGIRDTDTVKWKEIQDNNPLQLIYLLTIEAK